MEKKRSSFSGKIGFVLAAAGRQWVWEIFGDFRIWQPDMEEEFFF